jgi:hypothetical protein
MSRHLLRRLAVIVFVGGVLAAALLPTATLDVCSRVAFLSCTANSDVVVRAVVAVGAAMGALVIYTLGGLSRR